MLFEHKANRDAADALDPGLKRQRNRMAGLWAAELLGLIGQAAQDYAHDVAHRHEQSPDDEPVARHLLADLKGKVSLHDIRAKLAHLVQEARKQLHHEGGRKE
jgi:hypothetical protein